MESPRCPSSFSSLPSVLPTEGNEENGKDGNWVCVSSRSFWALLLRSEDRTGEKTLGKLAELKTGREMTFPRLAGRRSPVTPHIGWPQHG
jgi:hypothetical protein